MSIPFVASAIEGSTVVWSDGTRENVWSAIARLRQSALSVCAPAFTSAMQRGIERANAAGLDVVVAETLRSPALHSIYVLQGTTHARTVWRSWHGYGLAADVISRRFGWDLFPEGKYANPNWLAELVLLMQQETFTRDGETLPVLAWGGKWSPGERDYPHWYWGRCRATPSDLSYGAYLEGGLPAVWALVRAT